MREYLRILNNVLTNGQPKQPTRFDNLGNAFPVENGTIGTFCEVFRHNMSDGFPLLTSRQMPWRSIRVELEGFIKGITDKKWFQDRKCKFWDEWANPQEVEKEFNQFNHKIDMIHEGTLGCDIQLDINYLGESDKKSIQKYLTDLGPVYGYQWRKFGQQYMWDNWGIQEWNSTTEDLLSWPDKRDGLADGFDQFKYIVDTLKTNPYDRRMVCSAWNPNQMHLMALPSCHVLHQVVVYGNKLNLTWFQRSCDLTHGIPSNIASYALLLLLYCEESGLQPGELVGVLSDCHVYNNTIESAKELLTREPKQLPQVKIKRKPDNTFSIFNWTYEDVETLNYDPHPPINMGSVTV
jgi:thymidylate synthase